MPIQRYTPVPRREMSALEPARMILTPEYAWYFGIDKIGLQARVSSQSATTVRATSFLDFLLIDQTSLVLRRNYQGEIELARQDSKDAIMSGDETGVRELEALADLLQSGNNAHLYMTCIYGNTNDPIMTFSANPPSVRYRRLFPLPIAIQLQ